MKCPPLQKIPVPPCTSLEGNQNRNSFVLARAVCFCEFLDNTSGRVSFNRPTDCGATFKSLGILTLMNSWLVNAAIRKTMVLWSSPQETYFNWVFLNKNKQITRVLGHCSCWGKWLRWSCQLTHLSQLTMGILLIWYVNPTRNWVHDHSPYYMTWNQLRV